MGCEGHWRKRVGIEPTIRPAKGRIAGFEGREDHQTLFASVEEYRGAAESFQLFEEAAETFLRARSVSLALVQTS